MSLNGPRGGGQVVTRHRAEMVPQIMKPSISLDTRNLVSTSKTPPPMAPLHGNDRIRLSLELDIISMRVTIEFAQGVQK